MHVRGRNELNVYTTLAYPRISSFCTIRKHAHTRILKPFEDSELTGLKVDIAAPSCKNLECLRRYKTMLISSHTHMHTHTHIQWHTHHMHPHTTNTCITCDGLVEQEETTNQYELMKKRKDGFLVLTWKKRVKTNTTLWASLSGTFLQTLPDLVTPLKGHSLSPRSCPATRSVPSERFGY